MPPIVPASADSWDSVTGGAKGGAKGNRTPDPLLAKLSQSVQHRPWPGAERSEGSTGVRQRPGSLVSVVSVTTVAITAVAAQRRVR